MSMKTSSSTFSEGSKLVISASRRTDIPRWYSDWLLEQLGCGEVTYTRPGDGSKVSVSLYSDKVHSIVLWSKDFSRLLSNGELVTRLEPYNLYFLFTITGLGGSIIEPRAPHPFQALQQMGQLADMFGAERINWRFDPIIYWHDDGKGCNNLALFPALAEKVAQIGVKRCTFSFAAWYKKCQRRVKKAGIEFIDPNDEQKLESLYSLVEIASSYGISLFSCAQDQWLKVPGVKRSSCIDGAFLTELHPQHVPASSGKDKSQRKQCGCTPSVDIGSYAQTCWSGCRYCYANPSLA